MRLLLILSGLLLCFPSFSQSFWSDADDNEWTVVRSEDRPIQPEKYRAIHISVSDRINTFLRSQGAFTTYLPLPDGTEKAFLLKPIDQLHPALAKKYPHIRSYVGYDPEQPRHRIALSIGNHGVYGVYNSAGGDVYLDPFQQSSNEQHMVYFTRDHHLPESLAGNLHCGSVDLSTPDMLSDPLGSAKAPLRSSADPVNLQVYDIAIATTGEYSQANGGTKGSVLEAINVALTRVNFVFVRDMAMRFRLIAENEQVIYLDPDDDPYDDDNISALLSQNTTNLANVLGPDTYDLGHVFAGPCGGGTVGQAALGATCNTQRKARAASCQVGANDRFYINVVAHEIGHQFNATHTFNNCPPNEGQISPISAYEPGGGSTIMSYADACGTQSFQNGADPYFHVHNLQQMYDYSRRSTGSTCPDIEPAENTAPEISIDIPDGTVIPISTPFKLTADVSDVDAETITYCWEQYDLDPVQSSLGNPQGNDPSFRSYEPTVEPYRYFPRLFDIIVGTESLVEVLPDYARDLTFRCTVRDNDLEAGGVAWGEVDLRVTEQAGPFEVIAPNRDLEYFGGKEYEVRWDVANTDQSPVNCQFVHVLLSIDRGVTILDTLAKNTPNDGSVFVTFPDTSSNRGRIFVEAVGNVFFDTSDDDFTLRRAIDTTFGVKLAPAGVPLSCQPEMIGIQVETDSFLGYDQPIQLQIVDLPAGLNADFEPPVVDPGQSSLLRLFTNEAGRQTYNLTVRAASVADTFFRELTVVTQSNEYADFTPTFPPDGTSGIQLSTQLRWSDAADADEYDVVLASSPTFDNSTIIERKFGLTDTFYTPGTILNASSLYFWRVNPFNDCGAGPPSPIQTFHTANTICAGNEANDLPINISGNGFPTVESTIEVTETGTISDINIPFLRANYQPVKSLKISLISPMGTEVVLYDQTCGNTVNLSIGFDDEAPSEILCPPDDGIVFQPIDSLSTFIGEPTAGTWTLRVAVVDLGFGASGGLEEWRLEFCSEQQPQSPVLVSNDTLFVPPGLTNPISTNELLAEDPDNTSFELTYTVLKAPDHGTLAAYTVPLEVGDQFIQRAIETFDLTYTHDGSETESDLVTFVIEDGTGGFFATAAVPIRIEEGAVVDTDDPLMLSGEFLLFPVPARDALQVQWSRSVGEPTDLEVYDLQGRPLFRKQLDTGEQQLTIPTNQWPSGLYVLRVLDSRGVRSQTFSVQR